MSVLMGVVTYLAGAWFGIMVMCILVSSKDFKGRK